MTSPGPNSVIGAASQWAPAVFAGTALVCVAGAFVCLGRNSLWLDELYTAYFSDPSLDFGAFWNRANTDVHSPLYYGIIYLVRHTGLDFEIASRGVSAAAASLAIFCILVLFRRELSLKGRLFACAFAATSATWFYNAQNARSYSLSFLAAVGLAYCSLRLMRMKSDRDFLKGLAVFTAMAIAASFVHYYLVPAAGGFLLHALIGAKTHRKRLAIVISGIAILAIVGGFIAWQRAHYQVDAGELWFSNSVSHLLNAGLWTLKAFAGSLYGLASLALILPLALFFQAQEFRAERKGLEALRADFLASPAGAIVFALFFSAVSYLLISFLITPVISERIMVPLLPLVWILTGFAFDRATRRAGSARVVALMAAVLMTLAGLRTWYRFLPTATEDFRASASFINGLPGCKAGVIPAAYETSSVNASGAGTFYGYYLAEEMTGSLRSINAAALPDDATWNEYAAGKASGVDPCPVALWGVHFLSEGAVMLALDRAERIAGQYGASAEMIAFRSTDIPLHGLPFVDTGHQFDAAYVILLRPRDGAGQKALSGR